MVSRESIANIYHRVNRDVLFVIIFFIYASIMTWPFIAHPFTTMTAPLIGDTSNSVTKFDSIKQEHKNPFIDWHLDTIAAPEGIVINPSVDRVSFFSTIFLWLITLATSSVVAHGLYTFLGYFLTAVVVYFFLKGVLKNHIISFYAALFSVAFPLFVSLARAAPVYMHMWLYVLPIWAFYSLWNKYSHKKAALSVLSIVPALFWTPYFAFHILLIGASAFAVYLGLTFKQRGLRRSILIAAITFVCWLVIVASYYLIGHSSEHGGAPARTLEEAYEQSVHPLMLILPGAFTWWGQPGYDLLSQLIPRAQGTNLYIGASLLILAVIGILAVTATKIKSLYISVKNIRVLGYFALALSTVCLLFSLAPTIGIFGIDIPTPNAVVTHFVPALRAGQRLVAPLALGIIILAAIGLYAIFKSINSHRTVLRYGVIFLIACIALFDLSSKPPTLTSTLPDTPIAHSIQSLPKGTVMMYMNGSIMGSPGQLPCQLRLIHQQVIGNFCGLDIDYPEGELEPILLISQKPLPQQIDELHQRKVAYILVAKQDKKVVSTLNDSNQTQYKKMKEDQKYLLYSAE